MFRFVGVEEFAPRSRDVLMVNLNEGLQELIFFGYFFLFGGVFFLIISILKIRIVFPFIGALLVIGIGFYMIKTAKEKIEKRKELYEKGDIVYGTVVRHGRTMNPFSSTSLFTIDVKVDNRIVSIKHKKKDIWTSCPDKKEIIGFKLKNNYFFGAEVGCEFTVLKKRENISD